MGTAPGDGPREEADPAAHEPAAVGGLVRQVGPPDERYGPLRVRRYVRADGRALILFERSAVDEAGS